MTKIENKEEGVYYFGFSTCPWCIELVPILDEVLKETDRQAYVIDTRSKDFTDDYKDNFKKIYSNYYDDDPSVPLVIVISKDGATQAHAGTIKGHDAHNKKLSKSQKKELKNNLLKMLGQK